MNPDLTIVIPVRWEAENIVATVKGLEAHVHTPHTILVADDHIVSTDPTQKTVRRLQKTIRNLKFFAKKSGNDDGFGPAISRSITAIRTPYTVIVMGDGCDDPRSIDKMVALAKKSDAQVISACRYMNGAQKIGGPQLQHVASTFLNGILSTFGMPTRDATNAFKLYKTSFLRSILPNKPLPGVEFTLQLSVEGFHAGGTYIDIPTTWRGRTKGKSKLRLLKSGREYIRLLLAAFFT